MNASACIADEIVSLTVMTPRSRNASLMMSDTNDIGPSQLLRFAGSARDLVELLNLCGFSLRPDFERLGGIRIETEAGVESLLLVLAVTHDEVSSPVVVIDDLGVFLVPVGLRRRV